MASFAARTALEAGPWVVVLVALGWITQGAFESGLDRLAARLSPLVDGLHRYTAERGAPPAELDDLLPETLPHIPAPNGPWVVSARRRMEYARVEAPGGQTWELRVTVDAFGRTELCYRSDGDYTGRHHGRVVARGPWALYLPAEL